MEDSAKRRDRLQAMRMDASSSSTDRPSPSFSTPNIPLSNPLIYPSVPSPESQLSPHRFDYYTDPTAAYFSAGRNMNKKGEDAGHDSYYRPPIFSSPIRSASPLSYTAAQQFGSSHLRSSSSSDDELFFQQILQWEKDTDEWEKEDEILARIYTSNNAKIVAQLQDDERPRCRGSVPGHLVINRGRIEAGQQTEYHMHPANTRAHQVPSPNTSFLRSQTGSLTSPVQYPSPASGDRGAPHHLPRPMSANSSEHSFTPNFSNGGGQSNSRPMNSAYSGIRGSPHSHSSSAYSGIRGSPHSQSGRGRGRGGSPYNNQGCGSGRLKKLDSFFIKSLVKDPWRKLKPVVGNILVPLQPLPWLPKSIATKKPKVDETSTDIKPKQNLAEFLALAFEESQEGEGSMMPQSNE